MPPTWTETALDVPGGVQHTLRVGDGDSDGSRVSLTFQGDCRFLAAEELERARRQLEVLLRSVLENARLPVWKLPLTSDGP